MPKPDYLKGRVLYDALMAMKPDELLEGDWATGAGLNRGFFTDLKKAAGGAPSFRHFAQATLVHWQR